MRTRVIYVVILLTFLMLIIFGVYYGQKQEKLQQELQENASEMIGEETTAAETASDDQTAESIGEGDHLAGGGSGEVIFEIETVEKQYTAEDGTVIFEMSLEYPILQGNDEGSGQINAFFESWAQEKMAEYETDEESIRQSALEVYRESRDFGWRGPWSESNRITSVKAVKGYLSVLTDAYLDEGGAHGMPYREGYIFRLSDGKKVNLYEMTGVDRGQWDQKLRDKFAEKIADGEAAEFYEEAMELIRVRDMSDVGYYFSDTGVVFYLPPYAIAPYSTGYVEILLSFEETGLFANE